MKVKELIEILKKLDQEALVVMSRDAEGNGYEKMSGDVSTGMVFDSDEGTIGYPELDDELRKAGYGEDDIIEGTPCVVLWP